MKIIRRVARAVTNAAKDIKVIVTDVDGVLTDGTVRIDEEGRESFAQFNILDGFAVTIANDCDLKIIVISGRKSLCTEARCSKLGITEVYTGIRDKAAKLNEVIQRLELNTSQVAYIGDDLLDLSAMSLVRLKIAPKNAVGFVKQQVDYITKASGGGGVFREVVEIVLKAQGRYASYMQRYI